MEHIEYHIQALRHYVELFHFFFFFSSIQNRAEQLRVLTTFTKDVLFVSTNKAKL